MIDSDGRRVDPEHALQPRVAGGGHAQGAAAGTARDPRALQQHGEQRSAEPAGHVGLERVLGIDAAHVAATHGGRAA